MAQNWRKSGNGENASRRVAELRRLNGDMARSAQLCAMAQIATRHFEKVAESLQVAFRRAFHLGDGGSFGARGGNRAVICRGPGSDETPV